MSETTITVGDALWLVGQVERAGVSWSWVTYDLVRARRADFPPREVVEPALREHPTLGFLADIEGGVD